MIYSQKHGIQATHKPTGIKVFVGAHRSLGPCRTMAIRYLRSLVRWGKQPDAQVIRKYDFGSPCGSFIKDLRTGQRIVDECEIEAIVGRGHVEKFERPH